MPDGYNFDDPDHHVVNTDFGKDIDVNQTEIGKYVRELPPIKSAIQRRLIMWEAYEGAFGISDPNAPNASPLDLVRANPKETVWKYSSQYNNINRFIDLNVGEIAKIQLDDFLKLPRYMVETIFEAVERKSAKDSKAVDNATKDFNTPK